MDIKVKKKKAHRFNIHQSGIERIFSTIWISSGSLSNIFSATFCLDLCCYLMGVKCWCGISVLLQVSKYFWMNTFLTFSERVHRTLNEQTFPVNEKCISLLFFSSFIYPSHSRQDALRVYTCYFKFINVIVKVCSKRNSSAVIVNLLLFLLFPCQLRSLKCQSCFCNITNTSTSFMYWDKL